MLLASDAIEAIGDAARGVARAPRERVAREGSFREVEEPLLRLAELVARAWMTKIVTISFTL